MLRLAQDLPIVIEIVDAEENINAFLTVLDTIRAGWWRWRKVRVLQYGRNDERKS
jgi:uncharacterized protein